MSSSTYDQRTTKSEDNFVDDAPVIKDSRFQSIKIARERKKRKEKAKQGYIRWYLIEETFPEPKYIKPKAKGGGIAEYEYDGDTYLFPSSARLASEQEGMWTVMHRKGEADPVNLRDSHGTTIPADALQEYLTMRVSSTAPGLLDRLDMDAKQILMGTIALIILFAVLQDVMGGGF